MLYPSVNLLAMPCARRGTPVCLMESRPSGPCLQSLRTAGLQVATIPLPCYTNTYASACSTGGPSLTLTHRSCFLLEVSLAVVLHQYGTQGVQRGSSEGPSFSARLNLRSPTCSPRGVRETDDTEMARRVINRPGQRRRRQRVCPPEERLSQGPVNYPGN